MEEEKSSKFVGIVCFLAGCFFLGLVNFIALLSDASREITISINAVVISLLGAAFIIAGLVLLGIFLIFGGIKIAREE
jgi:hypothetical protein